MTVGGTKRTMILMIMMHMMRRLQTSCRMEWKPTGTPTPAPLIPSPGS
jgi:hypothetical protein